MYSEVIGPDEPQQLDRRMGEAGHDGQMSACVAAASSPAVLPCPTMPRIPTDHMTLAMPAQATPVASPPPMSSASSRSGSDVHSRTDCVDCARSSSSNDDESATRSAASVSGDSWRQRVKLTPAASWDRENDVLTRFQAAVNEERRRLAQGGGRGSASHSTPQACWRVPARLLPKRIPETLCERDRRFDSKAKRVFVCDGCGTTVRFSSQRRGTTYSRVDCDFAGSFKDNTWAGIPNSLRERAWQERIIDASWYCHQFCGFRLTGKNEANRLARSGEWRDRSGRGGGR